MRLSGVKSGEVNAWLRVVDEHLAARARPLEPPTGQLAGVPAILDVDIRMFQ